jgi:hypothetical protein
METQPTPENANVGQIERYLHDVLVDLEPQPGRPVGRGRPRILPSLCLWVGVLVCVLRGWSSQLAIWRELSAVGLWDYPRYPISDQAVYKRLGQAGSALLQDLFTQVTAALSQRRSLHPGPDRALLSGGGHRWVHFRLRYRLRKPRDGRLLPGKLAGIDLRLHSGAVEHPAPPEQQDCRHDAGPDPSGMIPI